MREIENQQQNRQQDLLLAVGLCLTVAVVLVLLGAIISATGDSFSHISGRDRVEIVSAEGAGIISAALVLGAVVALSSLGAGWIERARPLVVVTLILATAVALLGTYSIVNLLTMKVPDADSAVSFGLSQGGTFRDRFATVLPQIGTVFIALVAMVGGNRLGNAPDDHDLTG